MTSDIQEMINEVHNIDEEMLALQGTIAEGMSILAEKRDITKAALDAVVKEQAFEQLKGKDYGCGTANIDAGTHKVKVTVSKKVKWDEKQLRVIRQQIVDVGKDPALYIKEKLSVSENAYKDFPENIQRAFDTAREVTPSAPKIEIISK